MRCNRLFRVELLKVDTTGWRDGHQQAAYAGELRNGGEKGQKQLLTSVLPRLAQHEVPPASLVPQLIQLASASEDRCGSRSCAIPVFKVQ